MEKAPISKHKILYFMAVALVAAVLTLAVYIYAAKETQKYRGLTMVETVVEVDSVTDRLYEILNDSDPAPQNETAPASSEDPTPKVTKEGNKVIKDYGNGYKKIEHYGVSSKGHAIIGEIGFYTFLIAIACGIILYFLIKSIQLKNKTFTIICSALIAAVVVLTIIFCVKYYKVIHNEENFIPTSVMYVG